MRSSARAFILVVAALGAVSPARPSRRSYGLTRFFLPVFPPSRAPSLGLGMYPGVLHTTRDGCAPGAASPCTVSSSTSFLPSLTTIALQVEAIVRLGSATLHGLVMSLDGNLVVESSDQGARLEIALPLPQADH